MIHKLLMLTGATSIALATIASAETFEIREGDEANRVTFFSKAPMESFQGKTSTVSGRVVLAPVRVDAIEIEVEVDMASLDTGIGLRNRHMRENHLHTDEFPSASFRATSIREGSDVNLSEGAPHAVTVAGELTLHGVTREIEVALELVLEGNVLRVRAEFPVALSDYEIPRPRFLVMKLADVQKVTVDLVARQTGAGGSN